MSFWDGVANFGIGSQGYGDYVDQQGTRDYIAGKRARDEEVSKIELEKIRRDDALAKQVRGIASQYGLGGGEQLPSRTIDVTMPQMQSVDEEGNAMPAAVKTASVPAQANRSGMYEQLAQAYESAGNLDQANKLRVAMKTMESEGYSDLIKGVATGDDPSSIAQRFNQKGAKRIVNGEKSGDIYSFTYEDGTSQKMDKAQASDLGAKLGIFKKDLTIVPEGAKVIDASGATVAEGAPKKHNIDPLSPEGLAAKQQTEDYKAKLKALTGEKATELQRNVKFLVDKGIATDEGDAFTKLRTSMNRDRASGVQQIMNMLKPPTFRGQPDQIRTLRQNAENLYDSLHGTGATPNAARAAAAGEPEQLGGPGAPGFKGTANPPAAYPDAVKAPDGKWYVKKPDGYYLVNE